MVVSKLNFGRSGTYDWLVQRFSACILATYTIVMVSWLLLYGSELTFDQWRAFMDQTWIRVFTLSAVLALASHAWVGLWTIATDYIKNEKLRRAFLGAVISGLMIYIGSGISIVWGF